VRKTELRRIEREDEVTVDVLCNMCGRTCKNVISKDGELFNWEGLIEASITGGYGSKLGDLTEYTFSLCEDCLGLLYKLFVIKPAQRDIA
jgi:hypothetical protein